MKNNYWKEYRHDDTKVGDTVIRRYSIYLFDGTGTMLGYVRNSSTGAWEAYVNRKLIGVGYDSKEEAKEAVRTAVEMG